MAETQHDRGLHEYDTIVIDEAHERSLNIDFLLGHLRTLRYKRPDLKIVVDTRQRWQGVFQPLPR